VATIANQGGAGQTYRVDLGSALGLVSRTGRTQFRLTFTLDDNDDRGNDFAGFYSGENSNAARRPRLVVEYRN
jgi:hypothetical protein